MTVLHGATLTLIPTSHPRHSITETPDVAAALKPLRDRLGPDAPSLGELVKRGAEATVRELEAKDRAQAASLATFVDRLAAAPAPDLDDAERVRRATRHP